ncbi:MAG: DEAD/DEAH box helicase [Oligoflexales bacterium]
MSLYAKLREYQKQVVDKNLELIEKVLSQEVKIAGRQVTIAPTGSGKTFMMASIIEAGLKLPSEPNFVWLTHNKQILLQTEGEIIENIGKSVTTVYNIEQGIQSFGGRVLLFNVQKGVSSKAKTWLKKWTLFQKDFHRPLIFIIDEADEGMSGSNMKAIREVMNPKLELGFTASFKKKENEFEFHKVSYKEVVDAEMLVSQVEYQASEEVTRLEMTQRAIAQRAFLEDIAGTMGMVDQERFFIPKMIIQAPAKDCAGVARELRDLLSLNDEEFHKQIVVHTQNSRGLEAIESMKDVRFIIGDLMLERGWNCPEAYILLSTKQTISKAKGIQLLGRVIRMPKAMRFDEEFDFFNRGYVYIAGQHSIEESCKDFGDELPVLPPPKEVMQVEKQETPVPDIITFRDQLDKDVEDRDLIPIGRRICEVLEKFAKKCQDSIPSIRTGALNLQEGVVTLNATEQIESDWNFEVAKRTLISALCKHIPKNYANVVITMYQMRLANSRGINGIAPFVKEMGKLIKESKILRDISKQLDFVYQPYKWPPHKLVVTQPNPYNYSRALYQRMHLNTEEAGFCSQLNKYCEELQIFWVRNDPSDVKLFKGHAPDFIAFTTNQYAFLEFKGIHLLDNQNSKWKNSAGEAAAGYFMIYFESDTGKYFIRGVDGAADEEFSILHLKVSLRI